MTKLQVLIRAIYTRGIFSTKDKRYSINDQWSELIEKEIIKTVKDILKRGKDADTDNSDIGNSRKHSSV